MPLKHLFASLPLIFAASLYSQEPPPSEAALLQSILRRMETLEKQNQQMAQEIHQLRQQLDAKQQLEDRVAVTENRVDEQAQTKVEASQKFPISLTGELLFNAFSNAGNLHPLPDAVYPEFINAANSTGATVAQTMLGFNFRGPALPGDGTVNAHLMADFYSGAPSGQYNWLRLRTSDISLDWARRSVTFAVDKPLISPHQPSSLAEVSIPPLSGAGNLWLWLPQLRYEERVKLGAGMGITAQAAILQTDETYNYTPAEYNSSLEKTRPAFEGRVAFSKKWNDSQHLEVGGGFHDSTSHVDEISAPSRIYSVDWLVTPFSKLEISGSFFHGQNFGALGGLANGFSFLSNGTVIPVHGNGGWTQFSTPITNRLTLNLFGGFQINRNTDLVAGNVLENLSYAGNLMYHLSPNVIVSLEALQMRSRIDQGGDLIHNRYDLALAYLF